MRQKKTVVEEMLGILDQPLVVETVERLIRERDEARAELERWKDAADEQAGPIQALMDQIARLRHELEEESARVTALGSRR